MRDLPPDPRVQAAVLVMERNREELLAAFAPPVSGQRRGFPRSATFRWIAAHVTMRSLASTAMAAALLRPPWLQLLGRLVFTRRA